MRVLLVHQSWPPGGGGSAAYTQALARRLARSHEVTVLYGRPDTDRPPGHVEESEDGGIHRVSLARFPSAGFESYRDPRVTAALAPVLDRVRPELTHVGGLDGLSTGLVFEARRRGSPVVVTLHDFWPVCPLGQLLNLDLEVCPGPTPTRCLGCVGEQVSVHRPELRRVGRRLPVLAPLARRMARTAARPAARIEERLVEMRAVLDSADRVIAPSGFLRDRLAALGVEGLVRLPYGLPRIPVPPPAHEPRGRVRFGFLGSAIPSKGVHVLARAFRRLDHARASLQIHGAFPSYHGDTGYEARVRTLLGPGTDEMLRGPFPHDDLPRVLAGIDVVVVPSLWEENAPLVVQEALRARRPVVVSDHGGLAELVRDGVDGLRVPPGDPVALADTLRRLVEDETLLARLGTDPPHVPDLDEHVEALEDVYADAGERYRRRCRRVGVVVPDHGRPEDAAAAAASAADPTLDVRVLIVEDGPAPVPAGGTTPEILVLPERRGFAGAVNAGLRHLRAAGCDRILVLNSDARLEPGTLRVLAEALEDETLGAVGPVVLRESDGRVESRGVRLDLVSGRHRLEGHGERPQARAGVVPVAGLSGAAFMLSGTALDRVGPLDESYFHGFEDVDWCVRLSRQGLRLAVVLGARAHHGGGRTLGGAMPERLIYAARNHVEAVERLAPRGGVARWLRRLSIAGLNLAHAARQADVPRGQALRAVLRGTRDGWQGRGGPLETG